GKLLASGTPDEIRRNADVAKAYLGSTQGDPPVADAPRRPEPARGLPDKQEEVVL
ncbi:hypothetical protein G3I15_20735, partial [Streptomyces sp. SID10244]|nr:hypothetical protein [Streptomyces sp. SID10244]